MDIVTVSHPPPLSSAVYFTLLKVICIWTAGPLFRGQRSHAKEIRLVREIIANHDEVTKAIEMS